MYSIIRCGDTSINRIDECVRACVCVTLLTHLDSLGVYIVERCDEFIFRLAHLDLFAAFDAAVETSRL